MTELPKEIVGCTELKELIASDNALRTLPVRQLPRKLFTVRLDGNPVAEVAEFESQGLEDADLDCVDSSVEQSAPRRQEA
mgnify:CR=1 FL=1